MRDGGFDARVPSVASAGVAEFLSDTWIACLDAALRLADGLVADPPFSVATLVEGSGRSTGYRVTFGPGGASVAPSGTGDDDVVFVTDAQTAWELHRGELRAQDAFARGALKVRGRPELLAAHAGLFVALERALAPVRAETTFADAR